MNESEFGSIWRFKTPQYRSFRNVGGDEETLGVTIYNNLRKAYLALENEWRYYIGWKQHFVTH